jgi:hypothetical protein
MGQVHQFTREAVILNWNEKSDTNLVKTFHLIFITWGTILPECPSYVFRNKEGELQESAA